MQPDQPVYQCPAGHECPNYTDDDMNGASERGEAEQSAEVERLTLLLEQAEQYARDLQDEAAPVQEVEFEPVPDGPDSPYREFLRSPATRYALRGARKAAEAAGGRNLDGIAEVALEAGLRALYVTGFLLTADVRAAAIAEGRRLEREERTQEDASRD